MAYASVDDVAVTLGRAVNKLSSVQKAQIEDWIGKTERIIKKRLGDLALLDEETLKDVVSEVVARRFKNPDGKQNERIDDYGYGLDREVAKGRLYLTDEEWDQLTPEMVERDVGQVVLGGNPGYGPTAYGASDHPVRGWWD